MDFALVHQQLIAEIRAELAVVSSGTAVSELGPTFERLSEYFQALGICHLLRFADTDQFRENLVRSGHARAYQLRRSRDYRDRPNRHLALSRSEAFLDAVTAADLELALEIALLSPVDWKPTGEYEDDFCYYLFLQNLILSIENDDSTELDGILSRFQHALQGDSSRRFDVCRALIEHHQIGFDESLRGLLEERQTDNEERRPSLESYEFASWPRSFVSIEGLALLRIAEWMGMQTGDEYPLCPGLARLSRADGTIINIFAEIEKNVFDRR